MTKKKEKEIKEKKGFIDFFKEPFVQNLIYLGLIWLGFGFKAMVFMGIISIMVNQKRTPLKLK